MVESAPQRRNRTWSRGYCALWIFLAGCSAYYLFSPFADPAALERQTMQPGVGTPSSQALTTDQRSALKQSVEASGQELSEIQSSLREFSQQIAAFDKRLAFIERLFESSSRAPRTPSTAENLSETVAREAGLPASQAELTSIQEDFAFCRKWAGLGGVVCRRKDGTVVRVGPAESRFVNQEDEVLDEPPTVAVAPIEDSGQELGLAASAAKTATFYGEVTEVPDNDGMPAYGIELGNASKEAELTQLWGQIRSNHAALVAGLQPRRWLAPDNRWRLIAGPFPTARDAQAACELLQKAASKPCKVSVYAGDRI